MSQQTQISRVIEHHARFLERFPTVHALAAASPGAVIAAWSGLGYNRRARNLHAAASAIVVEHGGAVPSDVTALVRLPGIGPYTAAAIAVYAFGAREPVVDTNIRRLVGRAVLGRSDATDREVRPAVAELLAGRIAPARLIQALMDLGSLVCLPRNPSCATCPLLTVCRAARTGPVPDVPRKAQGRFEGSTRQARGAALRAIGARPQGLATSSVDPTILEGLLRDGLVERSGRRVRLPR